MQRQSLGSPVAKLHLHANGGGGVTEGSPVKEDQKRKDMISCLLITADEDENKSQKLHKPSTTRPEKFIHLIPLLTVVCFLVLYLSSYDPSQKDLAQFNGFHHQLLLKPTDSLTEIDGFGRVLEEIGKSDVLEIRSVRNLQELGRRHHRRHRKMKIDGF